MTKDRFDIHQTITDRIIAAIEAGAGPWQMPWHQGAAHRRPVNITSGKAYRGVNTLALWVEAQASGYASNVWGTYKQWAEAGCQVRKGEKAAHVVFYKQIEIGADLPETEDRTAETRMFARATPVFNATQVDGYTAAEVQSLGDAEIVEAADAVVAATGAVILLGGSRACYIPSVDQIKMPERGAFFATETSTATEAYYSTLLHELVHWTGHADRCGRDLAHRFGSSAYAMEELIAELGAAFLSADLGLTIEPRPDHAAYIGSWLAVLTADKRAIFTAASKASAAAGDITGEAAG